MTVKSFGVGEGIILREVLLPFQSCVALVNISGTSFLRFCSLFLSSDYGSLECGIYSCKSS